MLTHITVDEIRSVIRLHGAAAQAGDRLTDRMVKAEVRAAGEAGADLRGPARDAAPIADLDPLRASTMSEPLRRLEAAITDLSPEARRELHAVMLIGRGDFASREWDSALTAAETSATEHEGRALAEDASLGPLLAKGLYQLKLA